MARASGAGRTAIVDAQHALLSQTMARWLAIAADWLKALWKELKTTVMEGGFVQAYETAIKYFAPGHAKTKTGFLGTVRRPGAIPCSTGSPAGEQSACTGLPPFPGRA